MLITPDLLDEAINQHYCYKTIIENKCYYCEEINIKKYLIIAKQKHYHDIIIGLCATHEHYMGSYKKEKIELTEKDIFYIKLKGE